MGERWVSNKIIIKNSNIKIEVLKKEKSSLNFNENFSFNKNGIKINKLKDTSNLKDCANLRLPPRNPNFLRELHPKSRIKNEINPRTDKNQNITSILLAQSKKGIIIHIKIVHINISVEIILKIKKWIFMLTLDIFLKSFKPSKTGCTIPIKKILFGPIRFCENLSTFRSIKVKNAIEIKILINVS